MTVDLPVIDLRRTPSASGLGGPGQRNLIFYTGCFTQRNPWLLAMTNGVSIPGRRFNSGLGVAKSLIRASMYFDGDMDNAQTGRNHFFVVSRCFRHVADYCDVRRIDAVPDAPAVQVRDPDPYKLPPTPSRPPDDQRGARSPLEVGRLSSQISNRPTSSNPAVRSPWSKGHRLVGQRSLESLEMHCRCLRE